MVFIKSSKNRVNWGTAYVITLRYWNLEKKRREGEEKPIEKIIPQEA